MLDFVHARRSGVALVTILACLLVWMSYQRKYPDNSTLLERAIYEGLSPVVVATSGAMDRVTEFKRRYDELTDAESKNRELAQQIAQLSTEVEKAREALAENQQLRALLDFQEGTSERRVAARVLSADPRSPYGAIWVNRGRRDGVPQQAGVLTPDGVVGKVTEVAEPACKVQLVTDPDSGVGGLVQRSRAVGVVTGRGDHLLEMRYLNHLDDVLPGDVVVTSGLDGIFARGLVIGQVVEVQNLTDLRKQVLIEPTVQIKNIEHVLIATRPPDAAPFVALLGRADEDEEGEGAAR